MPNRWNFLKTGFYEGINLGNFLRRLCLPKAVKHWSLRSVQVKLDQDGRPSWCGTWIGGRDLSVIRGVGSSTVVPGSVGSYRQSVIAGAKLREGTTTILPRWRALQGVGLSSMRFHPIVQRGPEDDQRWTRTMVRGKNRIPYWIDRRLTASLQNLTMMLPSRLGCPLSLKTPNMGDTGI